LPSIVVGCIDGLIGLAAVQQASQYADSPLLPTGAECSAGDDLLRSDFGVLRVSQCDRTGRERNARRALTPDRAHAQLNPRGNCFVSLHPVDRHLPIRLCSGPSVNAARSPGSRLLPCHQRPVFGPVHAGLWRRCYALWFRLTLPGNSMCQTSLEILAQIRSS